MTEIAPLSIAVEPHHRRIRRIGIAMLPLTVVFYFVGAVWAYTRIFLCAALESPFACEGAIALPMMLWLTMIVGLAGVLLDLNALGHGQALAGSPSHASLSLWTRLTDSQMRYGLRALHPSHHVHVHNSFRALVYAGGAIASYCTFFWQLGNLESGAWLVQIFAIAATELVIWAFSRNPRPT